MPPSYTINGADWRRNPYLAALALLTIGAVVFAWKRNCYLNNRNPAHASLPATFPTIRNCPFWEIKNNLRGDWLQGLTRTFSVVLG
jgi:hypothetical protein